MGGGKGKGLPSNTKVRASDEGLMGMGLGDGRIPHDARVEFGAGLDLLGPGAAGQSADLAGNVAVAARNGEGRDSGG